MRADKRDYDNYVDDDEDESGSQERKTKQRIDKGEDQSICGNTDGDDQYAGFTMGEDQSICGDLMEMRKHRQLTCKAHMLET